MSLKTKFRSQSSIIRAQLFKFPGHKSFPCLLTPPGPQSVFAGSHSAPTGPYRSLPVPTTNDWPIGRECPIYQHLGPSHLSPGHMVLPGTPSPP